VYSFAGEVLNETNLSGGISIKNLVIGKGAYLETVGGKGLRSYGLNHYSEATFKCDGKFFAKGNTKAINNKNSQYSCYICSNTQWYGYDNTDGTGDFTLLNSNNLDAEMPLYKILQTFEPVLPEKVIVKDVIDGSEVNFAPAAKSDEGKTNVGTGSSVAPVIALSALVVLAGAAVVASKKR